MSNTVNITGRRVAAATGLRTKDKAYLGVSAWSLITQLKFYLHG